MFRWCAYCQQFIGEAAPLLRYAVTHGVCDGCSQRVLEGTYSRTPTVLIAQQLFHAIEVSMKSGEFTLPEALFQEAVAARVRPSDLLLGVLQPSLYRIGLQWERGEVTPATERALSAWCGSILARFSEEFTCVGTPTILLSPLFSNLHDLGVAFLASFLRDKHVSSLLIAPGLPDADLVQRCVELRPAFCGLSVALPTSASRAVALAKRIEIETHGGTRAILGGFAFRAGVPVESGIVVFHDDMSTLLSLLRSS